MALTQRLEIRQSQGLVISQQMRQALALLKMNCQELSGFVAGEVERNPLLDLAGPAPGPGGVAGGRRLPTRAPGADAAQPQGLGAHLRAQIAMMRLRPPVRDAALALADEVDDDGYLRRDLDALAQGSAQAAILAEALAALQACDPPGVGARNLAECFALQQRERNRLDPAMQALLDNLALLAEGRLAELRRRCGVDQQDFDDMLAELRGLDPRPGLRFESEPAAVLHAVPEVMVLRAPDGGLTVELNADALPRVLVNNAYAAEIGAGDAAARAFIAECTQKANWLVRSLAQRARTILAVASALVTVQRGYFDHGPQALKPLTLKELADQVGVHESTVSRVTAGKYLACERGTVPIRQFFSARLPAAGAGSGSGSDGIAAAAVQARLARLIAAETPDTVLSDDALVRRLRDEGVDIARRTVAKYREQMGIGSSVARRRQKARERRGAGALPRAGRVAVDRPGLQT